VNTLSQKQTDVLVALRIPGAEMPLKGLELHNVLKSLERLGLAHKSNGEWWASAVLEPEAPSASEKATEAPTAPKEKSATRAAAKTEKQPSAPAKAAEVVWTPDGDYKKLLVEGTQAHVGYLCEETSNGGGIPVKLWVAYLLGGTAVTRCTSEKAALANFTKKTGHKVSAA
jgi:hypothetical protein